MRTTCGTASGAMFLVALFVACIGPEGPPGPKGDRGENTSYQPLFYCHCSSVLDLLDGDMPGADTYKETALEYAVMRYTNGDVEVSCSSDLGILGAGQSAADDGYYPARVKGSTTGTCVTVLDYPPHSDRQTGQWRYALGPMPRAIYEDAAAHPMIGRAVAFGADDCAVFQMTADGEWDSSSLKEMY